MWDGDIALQAPWGAVGGNLHGRRRSWSLHLREQQQQQQTLLFRKSGVCLCWLIDVSIHSTRVPSLLGDAAHPGCPRSLTYRSFLEAPRQTHLAVRLPHSFSPLSPTTAEMTIAVLDCFVWKRTNMHLATLN